MGYAGIESLGSFEPDNLIAGPAGRVFKTVPIAPNQELKRGTVLGKITGSGQCVPVDKAASDGSQTVFGVLADGVTTGDEVGYAEAYLSGEFAISALIFGGNSTAEDHMDQARDLSIYFRETVRA